MAEDHVDDPVDDWAGVLPKSVEEWQARCDASGRPSTPDDQSRTWDGRVLDTKEKVLEFLAELEVARAEGRSLGPPEGRYAGPTTT